eukprot:708276-Hanusia_phi.AAC.1
MGIVVTPRNHLVTPTPHPHPSRVKNHPPIKIVRLIWSKPPVRLPKGIPDHPTLRNVHPTTFHGPLQVSGGAIESTTPTLLGKFDR